MPRSAVAVYLLKSVRTRRITNRGKAQKAVLHVFFALGNLEGRGYAA